MYLIYLHNKAPNQQRQGAAIPLCLTSIVQISSLETCNGVTRISLLLLSQYIRTQVRWSTHRCISICFPTRRLSAHGPRSLSLLYNKSKANFVIQSNILSWSWCLIRSFVALTIPHPDCAFKYENNGSILSCPSQS